jgi:hypothetical protein
MPTPTTPTSACLPSGNDEEQRQSCRTPHRSTILLHCHYYSGLEPNHLEALFSADLLEIIWPGSLGLEFVTSQSGEQHSREATHLRERKWNIGHTKPEGTSEKCSALCSSTTVDAVWFHDIPHSSSNKCTFRSASQEATRAQEICHFRREKYPNRLPLPNDHPALFCASSSCPRHTNVYAGDDLLVKREPAKTASRKAQ